MPRRRRLHLLWAGRENIGAIVFDDPESNEDVEYDDETPVTPTTKQRECAEALCDEFPAP